MIKKSSPSAQTAKPKASTIRIGKKEVSKLSLAAKAAVLAVVVLVAALMFIIGRGHSVFFDNAPFSWEGKDHGAPYRIAIYSKGKLVGKIASKPQPQRAELAVMGQKAKITIKVMETKGGKEVEKDLAIKLPYSMDGVIINLPAYLEGLPEEAYLSEMVFLVADEPTDEDKTPELDLQQPELEQPKLE